MYLGLMVGEGADRKRLAIARSDAVLWICKLCVSACSEAECNFILDDVPVFCEHSIFEAEDIDDDLRDRPIT